MVVAATTSAPTPPVKRRRFAVDVLDVGLSRVLALVGTLGTSVIIARVLGPEGNGLIAALTVVPFLVVTFAELGTRQATTFHLGKGTYRADAIVSALVVIFLASTVLGVAICAVYFGATWDESLTLPAVLGAIALLPLALVKNYATGIFLGLERIALFSRLNWLPAATYFVGLAILALAGALSATTAIQAQLVGFAIVAVYAVVQVARHARSRWSFDGRVVVALVRLGLVYATALFLITLNYRANILLLREWSTLEQMGLYVVGANIGQLIWQVPGTMSAVVLSRSANARDDAAFTQKVGVLLRLSVLLGFVAAGGLALVGIVAIPLIYGAAFAPSAAVLAILLPGIVAMVAFKILNVDLAGKGKPWVAMLAVVPALLVNLVLAWFLIPAYGAAGAAVAGTVTYLLTASLYLVLYCRAVDTPLLAFIAPRRSDFAYLMEKLPLPARLRARGAAS